MLISYVSSSHTLTLTLTLSSSSPVWGINFASGHYRPKIEAISMMYQHHKDRGFNLTAMHWVGRDKWSEESCDEGDWENFEVDGFDPKNLEKACHEVTTNPMWMVKEDV